MRFTFSMLWSFVRSTFAFVSSMRLSKSAFSFSMVVMCAWSLIFSALISSRFARTCCNSAFLDCISRYKSSFYWTLCSISLDCWVSRLSAWIFSRLISSTRASSSCLASILSCAKSRSVSFLSINSYFWCTSLESCAWSCATWSWNASFYSWRALSRFVSCC